MLALVKGGVNILEIGVPFSDPIDDGLIIQQTATRALAQGITFQAVLKLISTFRTYSQIPIILFTYFNPLLVTCE